ncbi:unnamed protein product [Schistosoma mattheei]|uniref:Uncharacterized protein n=1 Tax=Schistosoma mattheei TaxID=31246 RepID=A0A183NJD1_9TREM|nr:unnamed protein product [Schistosoma mattheei]
MFQLADSASALFSASAQAVTLACSGVLQSSLGSFQNSQLASTSLNNNQSNLNINKSSDSTVNNSDFILSVDRWDAGRLALTVPAAAAAAAAAVVALTEQTSICQNNNNNQLLLQTNSQLSSTCAFPQFSNSIVVGSSSLLSTNVSLSSCQKRAKNDVNQSDNTTSTIPVFPTNTNNTIAFITSPSFMFPNQLHHPSS